MYINNDVATLYKSSTLDHDMISKVLEKLDALGNIKRRIPVEFDTNPDTSVPMWLVTDKDGTSKIIQCILKPYRMEDRYWTVGNLEHIEAPIDSPYAAKLFGIFWKKAADELRKMGLPKWEDDPIEIELSRIKFNYF